MADTKISALAAALVLAATDVTVWNVGGITKKIAASDVQTNMLTPYTDNVTAAGTAAKRFTDIRAVTGTISNGFTVTAGGLTVTAGGLTVSAGTTAVQALTATTALFSGALTYGGVTLSNAVTGTGNMVLSASPTFTGTITVTGATITGLTAASVGAGTFPGGAYAFTGAVTLTGGAGNMTIISGTGASRTLIFQTTTSGSAATTALTLGADQSATFVGPLFLAATQPRIDTVGPTSVTTSNVTIASATVSHGECISIVKGYDSGTGASFIETVAWTGGGTAGTPYGVHETSGPAARTYSISGGSLRLLFASGTYAVYTITTQT